MNCFYLRPSLSVVLPSAFRAPLSAILQGRRLKAEGQKDI